MFSYPKTKKFEYPLSDETCITFTYGGCLVFHSWSASKFD